MGTSSILSPLVSSLCLASQLTCLSLSGFSSRRPHFESRSGGSSSCRQNFGKEFGARCSATSESSGSARGTGFNSPLPLPDHYEILGVDVEASDTEIRQAYRSLQKKHHPDLVGQKGHAMTLLLNEAYQTLMDEDLRAAYNTLHSYKVKMRSKGHKAFTGTTYSSWVGPDRPQGIFVDENVCVGCRECVHAASYTFTMDESTGCARVMAQWGDSDSAIKMAREVCPVNCIHLVERDDLPILEYLIRPQAKPSNGVYGGGWERPSNVFMAARTFKRQQDDLRAQIVSPKNVETPAQKKARVDADLKLRMGAFWNLWSWAGQPGGNQRKESVSGDFSGSGWPWKGLFGRSSTSDVLVLPVRQENVSQVVGLVQEWALTYASSSELPLPMPFRADLVENGVQLSLISASNGIISTVGSLLVTVEETLGEEKPSDTDERRRNNYLRVRRQGTTGTQALPGEGRILKEIKAVGLGRGDNYEAYHFRRP